MFVKGATRDIAAVNILLTRPPLESPIVMMQQIEARMLFVTCISCNDDRYIFLTCTYRLHMANILACPAPPLSDRYRSPERLWR